MTSMDKLQYYSPGKQIYYWFGEAFGVLTPTRSQDAKLLYMGTESQVKNALREGKRSVDRFKNMVLDRELSSAPEYYKNKVSIQ